jgi:NitT/TauT family transport system substrate-binding protein
MEKKRTILAAIIGLVALLGVAQVVQAQPKTVKVAATSKDVLDNLPLFVGARMGFFEEVGMKLDISYFRGGGEVVRGITTRSVDIGATPAASAVLIAVSKGEPLKIISGSGAPMAGVLWIVAADSPIKSVKDLKGRKVGFSSPGSLTHTVIQTVLRKEGLEKDVELVRVGSPGDSWAAVKNKIVDSGWHVSPVVYNLIMKKEARIIIDASKYVDHYQQTIVVAMEDVIKKDPDMIRNFLRARAKAVKFISDNAEKTVSIWAEELKIPVEAARLAYRDLPKGYYETGAPKMENLKGALQEVMDSGAVKEPLDFSKILDPRFLPR